jgi:uncharacterized protein (DUF1330 family)
MTTTSTAVFAAAALAAGFALGQSTSDVSAQSAAVKPAFLIASTRPIAPEKMAPYREKAMPLARAAGLEILASGNPALHVLEGEWVADGGLTIERYRSMDDLLAFWNSPAYRDAVKLRTPYSKTNFIVALEGR